MRKLTGRVAKGKADGKSNSVDLIVKHNQNCFPAQRKNLDDSTNKREKFPLFFFRCHVIHHRMIVRCLFLHKRKRLEVLSKKFVYEKALWFMAVALFLSHDNAQNITFNLPFFRLVFRVDKM